MVVRKRADQRSGSMNNHVGYIITESRAVQRCSPHLPVSRYANLIWKRRSPPLRFRRYLFSMVRCEVQVAWLRKAAAQAPALIRPDFRGTHNPDTEGLRRARWVSDKCGPAVFYHLDFSAKVAHITSPISRVDGCRVESHRIPGQWVSPHSFKRLELQDCTYGKGVFAVEPIRAGEDILHFGGPVLRSEELPKPYASEIDHYLQIEQDVFLGPSGDLDDFINHSCEPNAGLVFDANSIRLMAVRFIAAGGQVTFDYSTTMDNFWWEMECTCGSSGCRRKVQNFTQLPKRTQKKYFRMGIVPGYIIDKFPENAKRRQTRHGSSRFARRQPQNQRRFRP